MRHLDLFRWQRGTDFDCGENGCWVLWLGQIVLLRTCRRSYNTPLLLQVSVEVGAHTVCYCVHFRARCCVGHCASLLHEWSVAVLCCGCGFDHGNDCSRSSRDLNSFWFQPDVMVAAVAAGACWAGNESPPSQAGDVSVIVHLQIHGAKCCWLSLLCRLTPQFGV